MGDNGYLFPPIISSNSLEGWVLIIVIFGGAVLSAIILLAIQKVMNKNPKIKVRRKPVHQRKPVEQETDFTENRVEVAPGEYGTIGLPTGIRVTVEFAQHQKSYAATVINVSEDSFVVTLPPAKQGSPVFNPAVGDEARFFALREGRHLTFTTTVLQVFSGGLRACSFRHTQHVEVTNRRVHTRVAGDAPVLFTAIPQELLTSTAIPVADLAHQLPCEIPGLMQDISTGGCAMRTRSPLKFNVGDLVLLNGCLPGVDGEFSMLAGVLMEKALPAKDGGGSLLNMEFLAPELQALEIIGNFVTQQLEDEVIE